MPEKEAAHKINNFITAPQVRVVGDNIEQPEVMSLRDALNKADEMGLDLVEISPKADPPVCRIVEDRQGGGQGDPFRAQYRRPRLRF